MRMLKTIVLIVTSQREILYFSDRKKLLLHRKKTAEISDASYGPKVTLNINLYTASKLLAKFEVQSLKQ